MAKEIERKFLVKREIWLASRERSDATQFLVRQGYLSRDPVVRVRTVEENDGVGYDLPTGQKGFVTIKSMPCGITRDEYEYEIPHEDAERMIRDLCEQPPIVKRRFFANVNMDLWEVDEFEHNGLILAEIELPEEHSYFDRPEWLGEEVTGRPEYSNSNMVVVTQAA